MLGCRCTYDTKWSSLGGWCHCITCHPDGPVKVARPTDEEIVARLKAQSEIIESWEEYRSRRRRRAGSAASTGSFSPGAHARRGDPETSKFSAREVRYGTGAYNVLCFYAEKNIPLTDNEVQDGYPWPSRFKAHKRCSDLRDAHYIEVVGERIDPKSKQPNHLCQITESGRKALADARASGTLERSE